MAARHTPIPQSLTRNSHLTLRKSPIQIIHWTLKPIDTNPMGLF